VKIFYSFNILCTYTNKQIEIFTVLFIVVYLK